MRDDSDVRDDADECDAAACEACGIRSTSAGDVNGRILCAHCFNVEADAMPWPRGTQ